MSKETADILRKARAVIEKPENWTKGTFARSAKGNPVSAVGRAACAWCAVGAVRRVTGYDQILFSRVGRALSYASDGPSIVTINDSPKATHADVLALFDRAIAAEEAAQ